MCTFFSFTPLQPLQENVVWNISLCAYLDCSEITIKWEGTQAINIFLLKHKTASNPLSTKTPCTWWYTWTECNLWIPANMCDKKLIWTLHLKINLFYRLILQITFWLVISEKAQVSLTTLIMVTINSNGQVRPASNKQGPRNFIHSFSSANPWLGRSRSRHCIADVPLPCNNFQVFLGDGKVPGQMRHFTPSSMFWVCNQFDVPRKTQREAPRKHPDKMPKPPQLTL